jgi:hypothetical protein
MKVIRLRRVGRTVAGERAEFKMDFAAGEPGDGKCGWRLSVYRIVFDLAGLEPSTAVITGRWTSDNAGQEFS